MIAAASEGIQDLLKDTRLQGLVRSIDQDPNREQVSFCDRKDLALPTHC